MLFKFLYFCCNYSIDMGGKSFSGRLTLRIIGIMSLITIVSQFVMAVVSQIIIAKEVTRHPELEQHPIDILLHSLPMQISLIVILLASIVVMFFVCRRVISRMASPVDRIESDLVLARKIQLGMLRTDFPPRLYALLNPAKRVGGDLYDFTIKDDQLYFAIGDVSGKGIAASLVMAITRVMLRFVVGSGLPLDETLRRINDEFSATNKTGMFVTLFVARVDLKTGHMDFCNAGHNPILVIPPDAEPYFLKCKTNIAVGMFEKFNYEAEQIDLKRGTRIIAYTDGVTEAEKADQSLYGNERLLEWSKTLKNNELIEKDVVERLYASVQAFAEGNPQNDDITIVSLRL